VYQVALLLDLDQADVAVTVEIDKVGVPGPKSRLLADDNDLTEPDVLGRQELWVTRQDAVQVRLKGQSVSPTTSSSPEALRMIAWRAFPRNEHSRGAARLGSSVGIDLDCNRDAGQLVAPRYHGRGASWRLDVKLRWRPSMSKGSEYHRR
jgi:hypothetical protein